MQDQLNKAGEEQEKSIDFLISYHPDNKFKLGETISQLFVTKNGGTGPYTVRAGSTSLPNVPYPPDNLHHSYDHCLITADLTINEETGEGNLKCIFANLNFTGPNDPLIEYTTSATENIYNKWDLSKHGFTPSGGKAESGQQPSYYDMTINEFISTEFKDELDEHVYYGTDKPPNITLLEGDVAVESFKTKLMKQLSMCHNKGSVRIFTNENFKKLKYGPVAATIVDKYLLEIADYPCSVANVPYNYNDRCPHGRQQHL